MHACLCVFVCVCRYVHYKEEENASTYSTNRPNVNEHLQAYVYCVCKTM